tara:strand:+ start:386 stop:1522 length:1137 start_codon:yes stop_codon:yes gene_type:complete
MRIKKIEVFVIGPEDIHYTWSHDIPGIYQSNTIIRIYTDSEIIGEAGVWNAAYFDYDRYTAESLRHLLPILINRNPLEREELLYDLRPRVFPQPPGALAVIDNALWDIIGKKNELPIYKMLGAKREKIPSYASTVMYDTIDQYLNVIEEKKNSGFSAVKFHTWCLPDKDVELAIEARKNFPDMNFMLDAENNYDYENSLKVAKQLEKLNFTWFEAPMTDYEFDNYKKLTSKVGIKIIPSGNWITDLNSFNEAIKNKVWTATRTDMAMMGGISFAKKAINLSESADMDCEIMSWGYTLPSVANLHLMLSTSNCTYYEQPLPYDTFEFGMKDVLRTQKDGYMHAPTKPGLGVEIDWDIMKSKVIYSLCCETNKRIVVSKS